MKLILRIFAVSIFVSIAAFAAAAQDAPLPKPIVYMTGPEYYRVSGADFIRYHYSVFNATAYPNAMFAAAPSRPPCGDNHNSSRTWVDLYDQAGHRLYGFCALGTSANLDGIYFALPAAQIPPSWIYIELTDRQTGLKYRSNLIDTTM
jgi:hypothetical protein